LLRTMTTRIGSSKAGLSGGGIFRVAASTDVA
jgi:hypothetical protein